MPKDETAYSDQDERRWAALQGRQVVGVGRDPEEAYRAAKTRRPKEEPTALVPAGAGANDVDQWPQRLERLFADNPWAARTRELLCSRLSDVYLVGGCVRDLMLGRPIHDLDIVMSDDAVQWGRRLADQLGAGFYVLDVERGFARVVLLRENHPRIFLDLSRIEGERIEEDLARRDFTINALALELCAGRLIDPFDGEGDVRRRILRPVTPQAIANDPIRAVRAVRLAAELGFSVDASLLEAIRRDAGGLAEESPERIQQELHRMLSLPNSAEALRRMSGLGLWRYTIPELEGLAGVGQSAPHQLDVWDHTLLTVARLEELLRAIGLPAEDGGRLMPEEWAFLEPYRPALRWHLEQELAEERPRWQALKWAALLHDIAKPAARRVDEVGRVRFLGHARKGAEMAEEIMRRLRFSQREISYVCACVAHHLRPLLLSRERELTPRAQYRFFRDLGDAGLGVCLLSLADTAACRPGRPPAEVWEPVQRVVQALLEFFSRTGGPAGMPRLVTGEDLIQRFGLAPGPAVGRWLERVREEQAAGTFATREEALRWLEQVISGKEGGKSL